MKTHKKAWLTHNLYQQDANGYTKSYFLKKHPGFNEFAIDMASKFPSIGDSVELQTSHKMSLQQIIYAVTQLLTKYWPLVQNT